MGRYLSVRDVAAVKDCSRQAVYRAVLNGKLRPTATSPIYLFDVRHVDGWKLRRRRGPRVVGCRLDLKSKRFGRLVAIRATDRRDREYVVWECRCDCGRTTTVRSSSLVEGQTRSCGCLRRDYAMSQRKLNPMQVRVIRRCKELRVGVRDIAAVFKCGKSIAHKIWLGERYTDVGRESA